MDFSGLPLEMHSLPDTLTHKPTGSYNRAWHMRRRSAAFGESQAAFQRLLNRIANLRGSNPPVRVEDWSHSFFSLLPLQLRSLFTPRVHTAYSPQELEDIIIANSSSSYPPVLSERTGGNEERDLSNAERGRWEDTPRSIIRPVDSWVELGEVEESKTHAREKPLTDTQLLEALMGTQSLQRGTEGGKRAQADEQFGRGSRTQGRQLHFPEKLLLMHTPRPITRSVDSWARLPSRVAEEEGGGKKKRKMLQAMRTRGIEPQFGPVTPEGGWGVLQQFMRDFFEDEI
ncbi:hypothetical protein DFH06DRAFT_1129393 [Mycena polygramma]|nr:hypothetical protein DFH06DRAFT_1129393 [Mycena polygramma]